MTKNEALQLAAIILSGNNTIAGWNNDEQTAKRLFNLAKAILDEENKHPSSNPIQQSELKIY